VGPEDSIEIYTDFSCIGFPTHIKTVLPGQFLVFRTLAIMTLWKNIQSVGSDGRSFRVTGCRCSFEIFHCPGLGPGKSCGKPNWVLGIALIGTYTFSRR